jgi:hypothetical protein
MLFEQVAGPAGADGAPGVFCCGLRVISVDGSTTDVPDSRENDAFFGRPSNQSRDGALPQVRWVAAAESGTGSLLGAAMGPYRAAEQPLARDLLHCFGTGMLVLADRKFLSWSLAREFLATGAHILWRASASFTLKPVRALTDGTYLAELKPPRKSHGPVLTVRVIEYTVHTAAEDGTGESSEVFCLVGPLPDRRDRGERGGHPAGPDQLPARPGRRDGHRRGFSPLTSWTSPSPRSCSRSSCPDSSSATGPTGPARGKPRNPATSPPESPGSPASPTSSGKSSSTCSTPGKSPKGKAIGPSARRDPIDKALTAPGASVYFSIRGKGFEA